MADPFTGAIVGTAVNILVDQVLEALKYIKDKNANLRTLESLISRAQPIVREISSSMEDPEFRHPAREWLGQLRDQIKSAGDLVYRCKDADMGLVKKWRTSKESVQVCENISKLLNEASAAQWASNLSAPRSWAKSSENLLAAEVVQIRKDLERDRGLLLKIAAAVTSQPSFKRKERINKSFAEQIAASPRSPSPILMDERPLNQLSDVSKPLINFGGDIMAREIITTLVNGNLRKKWIGLWAMGGAGKTFTARVVYNDLKIERYFTGGKFWVTVSKDQPEIRTLVKQLFRQISLHEKCPPHVDDAIAKVRSMLDGRKKVLLILDDVWQDDILKAFDKILVGQQNVILVTTRDQEILRSVADSTEIIEIPRLTLEQSWKLFSWHAFGQLGNEVPADLEEVAREVAQECRGLPLALEIIGTTMADKQLLPYEINLGRNLRDDWKKVLDELRNASVNYGDQNEGLYKKLQLSVDHLSSVYRLKDCFFSFAAFPEDYKIDRQELLNMWIAEGIVETERGRDKLASREEEANLLFGLLVAKSMVQLTEDEFGCKIHDVMRDVANRNLTWNIRTNKKIPAEERNCLYAPGLNLTQFPADWTSASASGARFSAERLSLCSNDLHELPHHFNAPDLRVLILAENYSLHSLDPGFFRSLSRLKVLDLSRTAIKKLSEEVIRSLTSLVLLNLSNCNELQMVSTKIADLHNLETLILDNCNSLKDPPRLNSDSQLHTFSVLNDVRSDAALGRGRWVYEMVWTTGLKQVFQLRSLRRLHIGVATITELPSVSSLVALEELELEGLHSFPPDMMKLVNLKILEILTYRGTSIPALDTLPLLEKLLIEKLEDAWTLPDSFGRGGAFPALKRMHIGGMDSGFTFLPGCMPILELLQMSFRSATSVSSSGDFSRTQEVPISMTVLSSLKYLFIGGEGLKDIRNLEVIFSGPNCFPSLEYLTLMDVNELPGNIANLPSLRWMNCDVPRQRWPSSVLGLEKEGKIEVEGSKADSLLVD